MPATDEVDKLQRGNTPASRFFRQVMTRNYSNLQTTQGTYLVTPSGELLGYGHTLDPAGMKTFLKDGLKKWNAMSQAERLGNEANMAKKSSMYPEDGLVLMVALHKFYEREPRTARELRGLVEWNRDYAWFSKDEARQFLPNAPKTGDKHEVPTSLINRLARYHFTDTVLAWADPYPLNKVESAQLTSTVTKIEGNIVSVRFDGAVKVWQDDLPRFGYSRARLPRKPDRGYDAKLLGYATFDLETSKFVSFELVAKGAHHGGGVGAYTVPTTLGIVLSLAGDRPMDRIEPLHIRQYDW
ncbi:MAG: hypothetical protein IH944_07260 [Armatimonadetes bacterium]|nr:hypothetical protein [Armatimonadota bacterium]